MVSKQFRERIVAFLTALSSIRSFLRMSSNSMKQHGLVADFWPNLRLMQLFGMCLFEYHEDASAMKMLLWKAYAYFTSTVVCMHYVFLLIYFYIESKLDSENFAADTITVLFFAHSVIKGLYFAFRSKLFYRTLASWNSANSHPMFAESNARHRAAGVSHVRKLLMAIVGTTVFSIICWTTSTFFGDSTKKIADPENKNETITLDIPRLPIRCFYPWDSMSGMTYAFTFLYQIYWMTVGMFHANLYDILFCAFMVVACQQLEHIKDAMKPLLELSASTSGNMDLFRVDQNDGSDDLPSKDEQQVNIRGIYSSIRDFGVNGGNNGAISTINGPNGLNKKHEVMVRSAIKYWVERHKHIVRYVDSVGDAYGVSLLLHMLVSTVTLTLLAFQATKIDGLTPFTMSVVGYLLYTLGQVFAFCMYGNELIEVSSSVMEAAYSCQWYEGSDEAKTFVQIVCQQCQKSLSISGAKFFTVSLDLFASVLGAVVTYFMVLVQLK